MLIAFSVCINICAIQTSSEREMTLTQNIHLTSRYSSCCCGFCWFCFLPVTVLAVCWSGTLSSACPCAFPGPGIMCAPPQLAPFADFELGCQLLVLILSARIQACTTTPTFTKSFCMVLGMESKILCMLRQTLHY